MKPEPPKTLAEDRAIDLSIQFTLFWMPVLVLLSWWTGRPLMLLFGESKIFYGHRRFLNELIQKYDRYVRSSRPIRSKLLGKLRHSRLKDKLGGGLHNDHFLYHNSQSTPPFPIL